MTSTYCLKGIDQKKEFCSGSGEDWKIIVYKSMASPLLKDKKQLHTILNYEFMSARH